MTDDRRAIVDYLLMLLLDSDKQFVIGCYCW